MRVAAIYDIHGNLPALEAVLQDIRQADVDQVIVGGDVLPGPMPRQTIACLRQCGIPLQLIQGNGEREVLAHLAGAELTSVPKPFREIIRWTAQQLQPNDEQVLASWPETIRIGIPKLGEVLFCHATPRSDVEIFTRLTPQDRLLPIFAEVGADIVVCGHTHMQFDRAVGNVRVLNAGSVGMPFGQPGAYWLQLGPDIQLRCTQYDRTAAAQSIRSTDYPQADEFAAQNVLQCPTEEKMLEAFAAAELG